MNEKFSMIKVMGYNCPSKYLLMQGNKPVVFVNSKTHASECMQFIQGYIAKDELKRIGDKKAIKVLMEARELYKTNKTKERGE